jgi:cytochrome c-type biogenesis protein CcmH/NrfG
MNELDVLWFLAGVLAAVAATFVIYPWARGLPRAPWLRALRKWSLAAAALGLAGVLGLCLWLGSAQSVTRNSIAATSAPTAGTAHSNGSPQAAGSMDNALTGLESRLAKSGGSDADWELLAKSYEFMGRSADAVAAREKRLPQTAGATTWAALDTAIALSTPRDVPAAARKLIANADAARLKRDFATATADYRQLINMQQMTANTWADYADVSASLNGKSLIGAPEKYLQAALSLDPQHAKALWLEGSLQHETEQYAQAVSVWKKLAMVLGPDSSDAKLVAANLAEDQQLADTRASQLTNTAASGVAVRGEIVLSDALRAQVPAGLTLFVLAKSVDSPGAPVAVLRTTTGRWPVKFELNDTLAMIPERKLSTAGKITVEARVSKSGQATPQSGDLLGVTSPLNAAEGKPVRIVIERVIG